MSVAFYLKNQTSYETPKFAELLHDALKGCTAYADNDILLHMPEENDPAELQDVVQLLLNGERSSSTKPTNPQVTFALVVTDDTMTTLTLEQVIEKWATVTEGAPFAKAAKDKNDRIAALHSLVKQFAVTSLQPKDDADGLAEGDIYDRFVTRCAPNNAVPPTRLEFSIAFIDAVYRRKSYVDFDIDCDLADTDIVHRIWKGLVWREPSTTVDKGAESC